MFFGFAFLTAFAGFCAIDSMLTRIAVEGVYYAVHCLHNVAITYVTAPEVFALLTQNTTAIQQPVNMFALQICAALHAYHIVYYYKKLRADDWLHHGLMIGVALPIGGLVPSGAVLGFSLFFTTGLPGVIDYFLLFLTRNNWMLRNTEKRVNMALNVWIRSPGCVACAVLTCVALYTPDRAATLTSVEWYTGMLAGLLNYWNGQYFMSQVVFDAGQRSVLGVGK